MHNCSLLRLGPLEGGKASKRETEIFATLSEREKVEMG